MSCCLLNKKKLINILPSDVETCCQIRGKTFTVCVEGNLIPSSMQFCDCAKELSWLFVFLHSSNMMTCVAGMRTTNSNGTVLDTNTESITKLLKIKYINQSNRAVDKIILQEYEMKNVWLHKYEGQLDNF